MDAIIRFLIQLLVICFVAVVVWWIGEIVIVSLGLPAMISLLWKAIVALIALLSVLRAASPWLPFP